MDSSQRSRLPGGLVCRWRYALCPLTADKKLDHAQILPTSYGGYLYTIAANEDEDGIVFEQRPAS